MLILLPCHSLEDLSLNRPADEAREILDGWTAMFHPALIEKLGHLPTWDRASYPMSDKALRVVIVTPCSSKDLSEDWLTKKADGGATIVREYTGIDDLLPQLLDLLDAHDHGFDDEFVADFLAIGFGYLLVELLTRQLRYMSNLDDYQLENNLLEAIKRYRNGDRDGAKDKVRSALDLLTEAREYFYPVETHLLDLTLTSPSTINDALARQIENWAGQAANLPESIGDETSFHRPAIAPGNLFLPIESLQMLADKRPELIEPLKTALQHGTVALLAGEVGDRLSGLLPIESVLAHLRDIYEQYERILGVRPKVYARHCTGLISSMPQLLRGLGCTGTMHYTLDGSLYDPANQSKIRWQGDDGTLLEALVRFPIDASREEAFLLLPETLGETLDLDHAATVLFARWPSQQSVYLDYILRIARHSPAMGSFESIESYFDSTRFSGPTKAFGVDHYRSKYLTTSAAEGIGDPVSRLRDVHQRYALDRSLQGLALIEQLITGRAASPDTTADAAQIASRIAESLPKECTAQDAANDDRGYLVVNPSGYSRRMLVDVSGLRRLPDVEGPVLVVRESGERKWAVVEVPSLGYAWIGPGKITPTENPSQHAKAKPSLFRKLLGRKSESDANETQDSLLAELVTVTENKQTRTEYLLRNDYFELKIDPTTGAIRSLFTFKSRGNRMAQQVALRMPQEKRERDPRGDADPNLGYTIMAADHIEIVESGPMIGQIRVDGRLIDFEGKPVARFEQTYTVRRADRVLDIDLQLDPTDIDQAIDANPWDSYFALRFAWADSTVDVNRNVSSGSYPSEADLLESPQFVDLRTEKTGLTILTAGLAHHRRIGLRQLDTILIPHGESERRFRVGVGIDLPNPVRAAIDFMAPPIVYPASGSASNKTPTDQLVPAPRPRSAWLMHLDSSHVIITDQQPVLDESGKLQGVRLRLLETEGRPVDVGLQAFRQITAAYRTDYCGGSTCESTEDDKAGTLEIQADRVIVPLTGRQLVQVEIEF